MADNKNNEEAGCLLLGASVAMVGVSAVLSYMRAFRNTGDSALALKVAGIRIAISIGVPVILSLAHGVRTSRGRVVSALATSLVLALFSGYRLLHPDPGSFIQLMAVKLNADAPKQIDEYIRMDGASVSGTTLTIRNTASKVKGRTTSPEAWLARATAQLRPHMLQSKQIRALLTQGVTVIYEYTASDGVPLGRIVLTSADLARN
jgi:hypothetical protein